jgi:hypothetical protein
MSTFNTLYVTGGGFSEQVFCFKDEQSSFQWRTDVEFLKRLVADIFEDVDRCTCGDRTKITAQDKERLRGWIERVNVWFVGRWGKAYVPGDVRHAVNDIEANLKFDISSWD